MSTECKLAVTKLNKNILEAPVLEYPNDRDPYTLTTATSLTGIGAILPKNKALRIEFLHMLAKLRGNVNEIIKQLSGNSLKSFILHDLLKTIYRALVWISSFKEPDGMVARLIEKIGQFNFDTKHRAGKKSHTMTDGRA